MSHQGAFSSASLGRLSRLQRAGSNLPIHLLAMDHAVTEGWYEAQDPPSLIALECLASGVNGVVCHRGMMRLLPDNARKAIFLQLYGSPVLGTPKSQLLAPDAALTLDCVGVAVELNVNGTSEQLATAFTNVEHAQRLGLLTLLMVNYPADGAKDLTRALAIATQLAPDFIKISLPASHVDSVWSSALRLAIDQAPPVLLAGGKPDGNFERRLEDARQLGFSGTCVGRSYFDQSVRAANLALVRSTFATKT